MYKKPMTYLCANGFSLSPAMLQKAIVMAGLTWGMPPAQYYAMQTWPLMFPIQTEAPVTMLGLPVVLDEGLPSGIVQLRWKGAVLFTIESLAVPCGFDVPSA